jgi:hypothetical protein
LSLPDRTRCRASAITGLHEEHEERQKNTKKNLLGFGGALLISVLTIDPCEGAMPVKDGATVLEVTPFDSHHFLRVLLPFFAFFVRAFDV